MQASMDDWIMKVQATLGLEAHVDTEAILDVARDAAHQVMRPAAPVTTYLLGLAVARGADVREASALIAEACAQWEERA